MELLLKVVEVVPSIDRLIAAADNLAVARAAFDTAVALAYDRDRASTEGESDLEISLTGNPHSHKPCLTSSSNSWTLFGESIRPTQSSGIIAARSGLMS
jgi:hypothetical protein